MAAVQWDLQEVSAEEWRRERVGLECKVEGRGVAGKGKNRTPAAVSEAEDAQFIAVTNKCDKEILSYLNSRYKYTFPATWHEYDTISTHDVKGNWLKLWL